MAVSCDRITLDLSPFAYAFAIGVGFVVSRYLIAFIANDERGKYEAKYMFGEFILGLVLALSFSMIIDHLSSDQNSIPKIIIDNMMDSLGGDNSNYVLSGNTLLCSSLSYLAHVSAYSMGVFKLNAWIAMNAGAAQTYTASYNAANFFPGQITYAYSFSPLGAAASAWERDFEGKAASISQLAMFPNMSQYFILSLFFSDFIMPLLALSVVFRTLPFTKGFANLLLAIILTFLVILPILLYGESYVFNPPTLEQTEAVILDDPVQGILGQQTMQQPPIEKFHSFSLIVDSPFKEAATLFGMSVQQAGAKDVLLGRYSIDSEGNLIIAGMKVVNYWSVVLLNAKTLVNSAFLATINLLAAAVSIKTLQIMLGDTDSLIEVMLRWV